MWYSLLTCQCTSNTTMVSTPSSRQRRPISLCPSMAASRQPKFGPGNSERYIEGTWVIFAASASLPMAIVLRSFVLMRLSLLRIVQRHRTLRRRIDMQRENVRPRIVADRIEIHLPHRDLREVEFGCEQRVLVVNRAGQPLAQWIDDHAAAAHQNGIGRFGQAVIHLIGGKLRTAQVL